MPMNPKKGSTAKQQQKDQINKSLPQKWLKEVYWIYKMKSKKKEGINSMPCDKQQMKRFQSQSRLKKQKDNKILTISQSVIQKI